MTEQYLKGLKVPKDELTAIERNKLLNEGKDVDRIMCCIDSGETLAPLIGCTLPEYYFSADEDGRLPIILKGLKMVKERLGDKVPVSGTVTGPFTVASMLVGTENLLKGMVKQPDKVLQMMDIITENNNRYIQRLLDMGVGVGFADPVSSTSLLRVKQYEKFSLPFFQKNVDFIKSQGGGCGLHICGTSRKLWELLIPTGIGTFGPDNVEDMAEAKDAARIFGHYPINQDLLWMED